MNSALLKLVFVLLVNSPLEERQANMLISSIREFGGSYANSPVYVFMSDTVSAPCKTIVVPDVIFIPLETGNRPYYPFLNKVLACAKAEEFLKGKTETLVWMDVDGLVVKEPDEFILGENKKIAIRPVNLRNNVGLPVNSPVDPYWKKIYEYTGLKMKKIPAVETLVDTQSVRLYLNCAIFSINPDQGIFREWKRLFLLLVDDQDYQSKACITLNHKIFLHQAVFSAVISSMVKENQIQWFSQKAGYPLHHQCQLPQGKRAANLNQLESFIYENLWNVPNCIMSVIRVDEPLRTWLQENYEKLTGKGIYTL